MLFISETNNALPRPVMCFIFHRVPGIGRQMLERGSDLGRHLLADTEKSF